MWDRRGWSYGQYDWPAESKYQQARIIVAKRMGVTKEATPLRLQSARGASPPDSGIACRPAHGWGRVERTRQPPSLVVHAVHRQIYLSSRRSPADFQQTSRRSCVGAVSMRNTMGLVTFATGLRKRNLFCSSR